jgi:hypothetical protein
MLLQSQGIHSTSTVQYPQPDNGYDVKLEMADYPFPHGFTTLIERVEENMELGIAQAKS